MDSENSTKPILYGTVRGIAPVRLPIEENIYIVHSENIYDMEMGSIADRQQTPTQEVVYGEDMPGMTIEEFQKWTDDLIKECSN